MIRPLARVAALGAGIVLALSLVAPAAAEVQTSDDRVETPDPVSITFHLRATGGPLQSAVLNYRVLNPDGNVGGDVRAEVSPGSTSDLVATLTTNGAGSGTGFYIPVGSRIAYSWTLTAQDGSTTSTESQTFVFLDGRYRWQEIGDDEVTVYWYDNLQDAQIALQATADAIADIEALLATELPYPVRVVVYASESEGELAQRSRGSTFDSQVITGGSRVSSDILHIYDSLGSFSDIARHEAAHLVTKVAGDGPFTSIPSWLDEGVAVYAQADPGQGYRMAVEFAISSDNTLRLRNLTAPSNRPEVINQFYGQSWSTVQYMVDTYGQEQLATLFASVKSGKPIDQALTEVYGFDQDGLYNEWREANGLDAIEFAPITQATAGPGAGATRAPLTLPTSRAASSDGTAAPAGADDSGEQTEEDEPSSNAMTAIIVGVGAIVAAGALGGLGFRLLRSK